jgi:uncharacterized protein
VSAEVRAVVEAGTRLFNRGRYFEAHERWEAAWQMAEGGDRGFLESLVQLASGMHLRVERGGTRGTEHLLARALVGLEDYRPATHGVDVERLATEVGAYLDWLREVRRPHRWLDARRSPRIHPAQPGA